VSDLGIFMSMIGGYPKRKFNAEIPWKNIILIWSSHEPILRYFELPKKKVESD